MRRLLLESMEIYKVNDIGELIKDNAYVGRGIVIGKSEDIKCIMTLLFKNEKLMLMFLINKYKPSEVTKVFNWLKNTLGNDLYKSLFEVVLTDNGWEFSLPEDIELDLETGEKLINVFYTESYSSWQSAHRIRNR